MREIKSEKDMYWVNELEVQAFNLRNRDVAVFWVDFECGEIVVKFALFGCGEAKLVDVHTGWAFDGDNEERLMQWVLRVARWARDTFPSELEDCLALLVKPDLTEGYKEEMEEILELSAREYAGRTTVSYRKVHSPFILDC